MRQSDDSCSGFTLVELLVALALIGVLMAAMTAGLDFGVRSWRHAHQAAEASARASLVRAALTRLIASVLPEYVSPDRFDRRLYFEGTSDHASFSGMLPEAIQHDVVALQTLHLSGSSRAGGETLTLDWHLDLPGSNGQPLPQTQTPIMDGVLTLSFRYWGIAAGETAASWHDRWTNEERLPDLVHMELGLVSGQPLLVDARIPATTPVSCTYDPVSLTCSRQ